MYRIFLRTLSLIQASICRQQGEFTPSATVMRTFAGGVPSALQTCTECVVEDRGRSTSWLHSTQLQNTNTLRAGAQLIVQTTRVNTAKASLVNQTSPFRCLRNARKMAGGRVGSGLRDYAKAGGMHEESCCLPPHSLIACQQMERTLSTTAASSTINSFLWRVDRKRRHRNISTHTRLATKSYLQNKN